MSFDENFLTQSPNQCVIGFDQDFTFDYSQDMKYNIINSRKNPKRSCKNKKPPAHVFFNDQDDFDQEDEYLKNLFGDDNSNSIDSKKNNCPRLDCDHLPFNKGEVYEVPQLDAIKTIDDIITLGNSYHCKKNTHYYGLDLEVMYNLIAPLEELNELVGMDNVKENIINQILFFLQDLNAKNKDMLHTVLSGPPGVGKTELGKILGKVYTAMGILSKGDVKIVSRSDLIGKYLGHTAAKTQKVIDEASGGVLFIDEAYSLGNAEGRDSFSKECIDTINANLTERRDFLCIIAGYKDELEKCFFKYNAGLKRRFTFRYDMVEYTPEQLKKIFELKVTKEGWSIFSKINKTDTTEQIMKKHEMDQKINNFFINNIEYFPHFGGDIETLLLNCRIQHSKRVMFLPKETKKILNMEDIENGFNSYLENRQYVEDKQYEEREKNSHMLY